MIKEILAFVYLSFLKIFFKVNKNNTSKNKIVFLSSFSQNLESILPILLERTEKEVQVYNFGKFNLSYNHPNLKIFNVKTFKNQFKLLKNLSSASDIIIDNFYPFLGAAHILDATIIQTWHAVGAFKKFALQDHSLQKRPSCAKKRFLKSYNNIDFVLNGSKIMGKIFKDSFGLKNKNLLNFGMPSNDFYQNPNKIEISMDYMLNKYPEINGKTIITYAPTYRDKDLKIDNIKLDVNKLLKELGNSYFLILKLHPAVKYNLNQIHNTNLLNLSSEETIENVLSISDILITDYSSVSFDFSNLRKPIVFFPYDLREYEDKRGLTNSYTNLTVGPIAYSTEEIIEIIKSHNFNIDDIEKFREKWNEFSKGNNTQLLVEMIR